MDRELERLAEVKRETEERLATLTHRESEIRTRQENLERVALQLNQFAVLERLEHQRRIRPGDGKRLKSTRERLAETRTKRDELQNNLGEAENARTRSKDQFNELSEHLERQHQRIREMEEVRNQQQLRKRLQEMREVQHAIRALNEQKEEAPNAGLNSTQMQELEETWLNLQTTRARMEAKLPEIRVHALRSLPLTHEDKTVSLKAGEEWKQRIADSSPLRLGDFAEVVIDGGRAEPVLQDDEKRLAGRVEFLMK